MTDKQALDMPAYRFWAMEACIGRIQATADFRAISVAQCSLDGEAAKSVVEKLTAEMGEIYVVDRPAFVSPEPGHKEKLRKLMR